MTAVLGALLTLSIMPFFISLMKRLKLHQPVSIYIQHEAKKQTPTMGGLALVLCIVMLAYAFGIYEIYHNLYIVNCLVALICMCMLIGIIDDISNIRLDKNCHAFSIKHRLLCEFLVSLIFSIVVLSYIDDMSVWTVLLATITIVSYMNAYNITDGLDGLAATQGVLIFLFLFLFINSKMILGHHNDVYDTCLHFTGAAGGVLIGFLWFNAPKAKIFMGNTGSLAIGALIGGVVVVLRAEFISIGFSIILFCNAWSSLLQIVYFKITRGKRLFRIAPLHHLCETYGWSESQIVFRFGIINYLVSSVVYSFLIA